MLDLCDLLLFQLGPLPAKNLPLPVCRKLQYSNFCSKEYGILVIHIQILDPTHRCAAFQQAADNIIAFPETKTQVIYVMSSFASRLPVILGVH